MLLRRMLAVGAVGAVTGLVAPLAVPPAGAVTDPAVPPAIAFLVDNQQADGGFEVAGFPGFETPDAILAIAEDAQRGTGSAWSATAALAAVRALTNGNDPLDAIDNLVDADTGPASTAIAARSAKIIALVAAPLGLSATDFDPGDDSAGAVDLVARMDTARQANGSYSMGAQFNGVLYAAIANGIGGVGTVKPALITQIRDAQKADGSWDYTGVTGPTGDDVDTTALALQALRAAGLTTADPDVAAGVAWLARAHQSSGAWQAFGSDDPNSTSTAAIALSALGIDVTTRAWVGRFSPTTTVTSYTSPYLWLRSEQTDAGNIASPNDEYGLNTFPTSQAIQALSRQWLLTGATGRFVQALADDLAGGSAAAEPVALEGLGSNPSVAAQRFDAAHAVVWSLPGRRQAVTAAYETVLGRKPDPAGRDFWAARLLTISRPELEARLIGSAEYRAAAGSTAGALVDAVYATLLNRAPDAAGRAYWVARVDAGLRADQLARAIQTGAEYRGDQVDDAYAAVGGQTPSASARTFWVSKLLTARIELLLERLASSGAYYGQVF